MSNQEVAAMELTGERYIPHLDYVPDIAYEHWHRYLYAAQFAAGKAVLDIASGEGYGSHSLAGVARQVVGVDPDPEAVRHASSRYVKPNLEFRCGSAEAIPVEGQHVFDMVVSFETIEHIWAGQQVTFLREIDRLLKPDGLLLISTPNKQFYTAAEGRKNPFHRSEFYYQDYLDLLKKFFRTVHILGQKVYPASYLWPLTGPVQRISEHQIAQADTHYTPVTGDKKALYYMVAVCSRGEVEAPAGSLLLDVSEQAPPKQPAQAAPAETPAAGPAVAANGYEATQRAVADLRELLAEHMREEATQRQIQAVIRDKESCVAELQRALGELTRDKEAAERDAAELRKALADQERDFGREREAAQRDAAELEQQVRQLSEEGEAARRDAAELRRAVEEQNEKITELTAQVELMSGREQELRQLLVDAHDQLLRRDEELQVALAKALQQRTPVVSGAIAANRGPGPGSYLGYQLVVHQIREVVRNTLPPDGTVLVVSKGDTELMKLDVQQTWHFPRREDGAYAGYYPADSAAAIEHLEALRAKGADFLLFPSTALWWLEHYAEFRQHLEGRYKKVVDQEGACVIFALHGPARSEEKRQYQELLHRVREVVREALPPDATVLVVSKGDEELLRLDGRRGWHFPQQEDGTYAGYNPADSAAAIEHLEALRAKGADFLLFPSTALWWLEHYAEFRQHLEGRYQRERSDASCVIYRINRGGVPAAASSASAPASVSGRA
jgi:SAM-dependent methyltransferase